MMTRDEFQSTPPVRGATIRLISERHTDMAISIHAPRAGGDLYNAGIDVLSAKFQSTPPVRGATKN